MTHVQVATLAIGVRPRDSSFSLARIALVDSSGEELKSVSAGGRIAPTPAEEDSSVIDLVLDPSDSVPTAMTPEETSILLTAADFQRIGLTPRETRLTVIRSAAMRASKSLAEQQLASPTDSTEQQLFRVAVSTYRLMDPRQRPDHYSRAHVGRIRPGALFHAGQAWFAAEDGTTNPGPIELGDGDDVTSGAASHRQPELPSIRPRLARGIRNQASEPRLLLMLIGLLLATAIGLFLWGRQYQQRARPASQPPSMHRTG